LPDRETALPIASTEQEGIIGPAQARV